MNIVAWALRCHPLLLQMLRNFLRHQISMYHVPLHRPGFHDINKNLIMQCLRKRWCWKYCKAKVSAWFVVKQLLFQNQRYWTWFALIHILQRICVLSLNGVRPLKIQGFVIDANVVVSIICMCMHNSSHSFHGDESVFYCAKEIISMWIICCWNSSPVPFLSIISFIVGVTM